MAKRTGRKIPRDQKLNRESAARAAERTSRMSLEQERMLTDDERLDEFRRAFFQSALPDLPKIPGYHVCWLTTTNPRDSIPGRMRLGYEPVKASDIPGWEHASVKTGEYAGCIGVNEMIAFKLPDHLYEAYMYEAHHRQPLEEEGKLEDARMLAEQSAAQISPRGIKLEREQGIADLGEAPEPPGFEEYLNPRASGR